MGNKIDTNIPLNERLNNQIKAKIGVNKDPESVMKFKNLLKSKLGESKKKKDGSDVKAIESLDKLSIYDNVNKLMNKIYSDSGNINIYDSFFVYDIIEREGDKSAAAEFYKDNMLNSMENKPTDNPPNISLVKSDEIQIDNYTEENMNTSMDISMTNKITNTIAESKTNTRSPLRKKPTNPPVLNIKMSIKDLIRQEAIESSFVETNKKDLPIPNRTKEVLNTKKLSKMNVSLTNVNDKSFIDMVDTLSSYPRKIINSSKSPVNNKIKIK